MEKVKKSKKRICIWLQEPTLIVYLEQMVSNGGYESYAEVVREALRLRRSMEIKMRVTV